MTELLILPFSEDGLPTGYHVERVTTANMNDEPEKWLYAVDRRARTDPDVIARDLPRWHVNGWPLSEDAEGNIYYRIVGDRIKKPVVRICFDAGPIVGKEAYDVMDRDEMQSGMVMTDGKDVYVYRLDREDEEYVCLLSLNRQIIAWEPFSPEFYAPWDSGVNVLRVAETLEYTLK